MLIEKQSMISERYKKETLLPLAALPLPSFLRKEALHLPPLSDKPMKETFLLVIVYPKQPKVSILIYYL